MKSGSVIGELRKIAPGRRSESSAACTERFLPRIPYSVKYAVPEARHVAIVLII